MIEIDAKKNEIIVGSKNNLVKKEIKLKNLNFLYEDQNEIKKDLFVKVRSTGKLIKARVELNNGSANVNLFEEEYGISPGQACVFYSKDEEGFKVLGGGWITK